jgi:hypothetical protein
MDPGGIRGDSREVEGKFHLTGKDILPEDEDQNYDTR